MMTQLMNHVMTLMSGTLIGLMAFNLQANVEAEPIGTAQEQQAEADTNEVANEEDTERPGILKLIPMGDAQGEGQPDSITSSIDELAAQAERAEDKMASIEHRVEAINLILSKGLEPACTRWLLHVPLPSTGAADANAEGWMRHVMTQDEKALLTRVSELTDAANSDLESLEGVDAEAIGPVRQQLRDMTKFANAFQALLNPGDDAIAARRRAASGLSVLLEQDDEATALAAALWYAALRGFEDDREPARSVLREPLERVKGKMSPLDFFGRLHRCRLSVNVKRPAAVLALLMQMEEYCDDWFPDLPTRDAARQTLARLRLSIMQAWHTSIPTSRTKEREFCQTRINELQQQLRDAMMFRLTLTVPFYVETIDE
ncbi:MAG: hypothetical protein ACPGXK_14725 [Phycisphaerae bacterium]